MRTITRIAFFALAIAAAGCGGDDSDTNGTSGTVGTNGTNGTIGTVGTNGTNGTGGTGVSATGALSETCNPQGAPETECAMGGVCLAQQGQTVGLCSVQCTTLGALEPACTNAYDGPGIGACVIGVTPGPGEDPIPFCAILCQEDSGQAGCDDCDRTCPAGFTCGAAQNGIAVCEAIQSSAREGAAVPQAPEGVDYFVAPLSAEL